MSQGIRTSICWTLGIAALAWSTAALADYRVTCESRDNRYQRCPLNQPGYVTMHRQLSNARCRKGRDWDYDRREVWVDDGCRAEFNVATYGHEHRRGSSHGGSSRHDDHKDAKVAAGVLVGAAVLGALIHNANKHDAKYDDEGYQGARHNSYVPAWMVGTFTGYNPIHNASIRMTISRDGEMTAVADGQTLRGWVNGGELHVGSEVFTISQSRDGFVTSQVGDRHNQVHYHRTR
ncbi:DUF3011 domain-containing protein [Lysobacter maris]|uniref:DUF3011 domain-containing protein n=1 Tax=Marilutibacter maris TaxID=1605891 RepID=A0A508B3N5_9GAMM|nr:DUF3011 domain-containing protein [Lysobacter maris]KAB8198140.1 DUF3011 domain-containing protein [Lysobacter maris]